MNRYCGHTVACLLIFATLLPSCARQRSPSATGTTSEQSRLLREAGVANRDPTREGPRRAYDSVRWLAFSPDGESIAVVLGNERATRERGLYVLKGKLAVSVGRCDSLSAAWLGPSQDLVYGITDDGGRARLVALSPFGRIQKKVLSPPFRSDALGAIGTRDQMAAVVSRRRGGAAVLVLWQRKVGRVSRYPIPAFLRVSVQAPPVISNDHRIVALLHQDGYSLIGFDLRSSRWVRAVSRHPLPREDSPVWRWDERSGNVSWNSGGWTEPDQFLVDEKALAVWDLITSEPMGPCIRQGSALVMPSWNELVPLALTEGHARLPVSSFRFVRSQVIGVSVAADLSTVAVSYRGGVCGLIQKGMPQQGLITDGSVTSPAISLSPNGRQLATVRWSRARQAISLVRTETGQAVAMWKVQDVANARRSR